MSDHNCCVSSAIRRRLWPAVFAVETTASAEQKLEVSAKLFDVFDQHAIAPEALPE